MDNFVQTTLQRLGGRELASVFDEETPLLSVGLTLMSHKGITAVFFQEHALHQEEQLVVALYGMREHRYFASPTACDRWTSIPALQLALLRETGKSWGTIPDLSK